MRVEVRGGDLRVPDLTLPRAFLRSAARTPERRAVRYHEPGAEELSEVTWAGYEEAVRLTAHGLLARGVAAGDRVAILSETSYPWTVADLATLAAGAVSTSIYTTFDPRQVGYLLEDATPRVLFVDDQSQIDKLLEIPEATDGLETIVSFEPVDAGPLAKRTVTLAALQDEGADRRAGQEEALAARIDDTDPRDAATIIYTSGTTGVPKGCISTHRNYVASAAAVDHLIDVGHEDVGLGFLPLAHSYQRQNTFFILFKGIESVITSPSRLATDLPAVQPTLFTAVPRIFERLYEAVLARLRKDSPVRKAVAAAAFSTARAAGRATSDGGNPGPLLRARHGLFDRLVYGELRKALGLSRVRYVFTGAAAIRPDLLYWLRGIGVPILEGYGLTETAAPSNLNPPGRFKPGTVGPPLPGVAQRVVESGEVLTRGPIVFQGYWNLPDETTAAFTEDGWFRTGDLGELDADGYLRIIDRLKAIEVLSTGENIAPVPIEEALKVSDWIDEAMVVGSDRKFVSALLQPAYGRLLAYAGGHGIKVEEGGVRMGLDAGGTEVPVGVPQALLDDPRVQALFAAEVERANADFSPYEQVKRFRLVPRAMSIERDELTPTLKKKRRVLRENWDGLIEEMYPEEQRPR